MWCVVLNGVCMCGVCWLLVVGCWLFVVGDLVLVVCVYFVVCWLVCRIRGMRCVLSVSMVV